MDVIELPILFALKQAGIDVVDGQQVFLEARSIKTRDEISLLTQAASMVDAAYDKLYEFLRPGVRENETVGPRLQDALRPRARSTSRASTRSRASGARRTRTSTPTGIIRPGDPAFFDILHSYNGYRTCYYRTFAVGSASTAQNDAYIRAREYMDRAIALVQARCHHRRHRQGLADRPGVRVPRRGGRVRPPVRPRRRPVDLGEADLLAAGLAGPSRRCSKEGMFFALETYWPSADGIGAARIEEEIVVTATGCEVVTKFPAEDLLVAGQRYFSVGGQLPVLRSSQSHLNTAAGRGDE